MLYFAYGANLNVRGMKRRCPQAQAIGVATLNGYRLEFRRFITLAPDPKGTVPGVLFELTPACRRALDTYEGADYSKIEVKVATAEGDAAATAYIMKSGERAPPTIAYYNEIARGYTEWKFDVQILRRARLAILEKPEKAPRRLRP